MITGSIPPGSGLSSSAALIVASLLAILLGNDLTGKMVEGEDRPLISNADLVQLARQAEAQIGVNSGGMDQSASVLSKQGSGLYVSFTPALGVESVQLPVIWKDGVPSDSLVMVIANSLTKHDLAHGATKQYNLRVMETLVGARILGQALGIVDDNESERIQLREVAGRYAGEPKLRDLTDETALTTDKLEQAIQSILVKVDEILGPDSDLRHLGHLPEGLPKLCGMSDQDFRRIYLDFIKIDTSDQGGRLCLYKRVTHVFSEALRVLQVMKACRSQELNAEEDGVKLVGRLMNESHESCRDLYECSNEQLDELVSVCRKAGSIGSRLSG
jgi:galactokinase